jgi:hypothetical protein
MTWTHKFLHVFWIGTLAWCLSGLLFRALLYPQIPLNPGDAHGLGDLIDGLFGLFLMLLCLINGILALVFWARKNPKLSIRHLSVGLLSWLLYEFLHKLLA